MSDYIRINTEHSPNFAWAKKIITMPIGDTTHLCYNKQKTMKIFGVGSWST